METSIRGGERFRAPPATQRLREIHDRHPRVARRRDAQRLGGEQRALRVENLEERRSPGVVAERRDRKRLPQLLATGGLGREHVACRPVSHQCVVHFPEGVLHRLLGFHRHAVTAGGSRFDIGLDRFQREQRLEQPETRSATRLPAT